MKNNNISICNEIIHPGEQLSLALPLPELFSCAPMYMPIKVVHGKKKGPCLLVIAAMHGNELNGAEIINNLLQLSAIKKLRGTLIAVPIMNVHGFVNKTKTSPDGTILSNNFPGDALGSHAARFAHIFCSEIFSQADYCVDLRTGWLNHSNLPQIFATHDNPAELDLAFAFGAPVISEALELKGSLRAYANKMKTPYLIYEAGEAMRFDEAATRIGVKGLVNVMRKINMLFSTGKVHPKQKSLVMRDSFWVRSPTSGINHSQIKLGQQVKKNEQLSVVKDPFGAGTNEPVNAPFSGIIVSVNNLPLVYEGEILFQIATFKSLSLAAAHIEDWIDESSPELENA